MNIAGPQLDRPEHQEVDQLDDGGFTGHIAEMADFRSIFRFNIQFFGFQIAHQPGHGTSRLVDGLNNLQNLRLVSLYRNHRSLEGDLHGGLQFLVLGLSHGQENVPIFLL